jgi:hypothetical protein
MVKKSGSSSRAKKYFVKQEDGIFVVNETFFEQIKSRSVALGLAMRTWHQLHDQLRVDAVDGENTFIGNMKVITGLERSLVELDKRHPYLLLEVRSIERRHNGMRTYTC